MKRLLPVISIYGFSHLLVDAMCISLLFSLNKTNNLSESLYLSLILFYNLIAFGTQPIIGYICDRINKPKLFAIIGMLLCVSGIVLIKLPILCMLIISIGNAFFHVGGGIISLYMTKDKATAPGLFVAPGAIGVFIAPYLRDNMTGIFVIAGAMIVMVLVISRVKVEGCITYEEDEPVIDSRWGMIVIALLFVIGVRSLIGGALVFTWKTTMVFKIAALSAVVLGKAFGGILGDRFGFKNIGVGGLILSATLLYFGINNWYCGLLGLMLFNYTMPITLTLLVTICKKYKGFAFGLTTLALAIGYLFHYINGDYYSGQLIFVIVLVLLSAIALYGGMAKMLSLSKMKGEEIDV